ncbi:pseudouridine synthase [Trametes cingulata]|nr:pseudouridine synthase [Trametes cingulata]
MITPDAVKGAAQHAVKRARGNVRPRAAHNGPARVKPPAQRGSVATTSPPDERNRRTLTDAASAQKGARPEDLLLYADRSVVVLNKPRNLISQLSQSRMVRKLPESIRDIQQMLGLKEDLRTVHRLDKPTTGVILLAKTGKAAREMASQIYEKKIRKTYLALVLGGASDFPEAEGVMKTLLECRGGRVRSVDSGEPIAPLEAAGDSWLKDAVTEYRVLSTSPKVPLSLLSLDLVTGRKHQIRAQLAQHLRTPILFDPIFGDRGRSLEVARALKGNFTHSLYLHASRITCIRYCRLRRPKQVRLSIGAPLPVAFVRACRAAGIPLDVDQLTGGVWINDTKVRGVLGSVNGSHEDVSRTSHEGGVREDVEDVIQDLGGRWYGPTELPPPSEYQGP